MSKRKAAIEEAAAIAEGIFQQSGLWTTPYPPNFYDCVSIINQLRKSRISGFNVEFERILLLDTSTSRVGIYVHIGDFEEKA